MGSGIDKHKLENSIYELLIGTEEINSVLKKQDLAMISSLQIEI